MISKERLEELIKKCALIYGIEFNEIESYDLSDEDICISPINFGEHGLRVFNSLGYWNDIEFKNLFETKVEAEWYREFGCIERTERLELPTWEDFNRVEFYTTSGRAIFKKIIESYPISINSDELKDYEFIEIAEIMFDNGSCYYYHEPATKENYIKACRKCKELFLGEKDDNT